jgi:hypothetical protein
MVRCSECVDDRKEGVGEEDLVATATEGSAPNFMPRPAKPECVDDYVDIDTNATTPSLPICDLRLFHWTYFPLKFLINRYLLI